MCGVVWCKSRQILAISKNKFLFLQPKYKNTPHYTTNIYKIMQKISYVAPEMEIIEVEIEDSVLLYNSPTGEGYGNQDDWSEGWS